MAKKTKSKPKARNPQDATRRNVQAGNKAIADLDARIEKLETQVERMGLVGADRDDRADRAAVVDLDARVKALEERTGVGSAYASEVAKL